MAEYPNKKMLLVTRREAKLLISTFELLMPEAMNATHKKLAAEYVARVLNNALPSFVFFII